MVTTVRSLTIAFMSSLPGPFSRSTTPTSELEGLYEPRQPARWPTPRLLMLNKDLAAELAFDTDALRAPDRVAALVSNAMPEGASPVAQAYAGHQFGRHSPRLGDGRAPSSARCSTSTAAVATCT